LAHTQPGIFIRPFFGGSDILDENNIQQNGLHLGVEYGFRLKNKRLEFHPAIGYRFAGKKEQYSAQISSIDLDFNTSIYPFDFGGDCDCPTFSKDGNLIKKGFFLELQPGVGRQTLERIIVVPDDDYIFNSEKIIWKLGIGAGLDIGLSKQITITPLVAHTWISSAEWNGLQPSGHSRELDDQRYWSTGLRLSFNLERRRW